MLSTVLTMRSAVRLAPITKRIGRLTSRSTSMESVPLGTYSAEGWRHMCIEAEEKAAKAEKRAALVEHLAEQRVKNAEKYTRVVQAHLDQVHEFNLLLGEMAVKDAIYYATDILQLKKQAGALSVRAVLEEAQRCFAVSRFVDEAEWENFFKRKSHPVPASNFINKLVKANGLTAIQPSVMAKTMVTLYEMASDAHRTSDGKAVNVAQFRSQRHKDVLAVICDRFSVNLVNEANKLPVLDVETHLKNARPTEESV